MQKAEKHKQKLMEQEKMYYEQLAIRIKLNRDELENEKIQQVIRKKDEEKENALLEQWEKAEQCVIVCQLINKSDDSRQ